jgi:transketolase
LVDTPTDTVDVALIATGSEVALALAARDLLATQGVGARVVSMPCLEWFDAQSDDYRESVLPLSVRARVSIEAGIAQGWWKYVGSTGRCVSIETYGASADPTLLFAERGFTPEAVAAAASESIAHSARS